MDDSISLDLYTKLYGNPKINTPFGIRYIVNADSTASGYPYKPIEKWIANNLHQYYSNTHSNAYPGQLMSYCIGLSKNDVRKHCNCSKDDVVIFTGNGCSGTIVHLIHLMNLKNINKKDYMVLLSVNEHHSNYLPWKNLGCEMEIIDIDKQGKIDLSCLVNKLEYARKLNKKIIVSFNATSNVNGVHQETSIINQIVHQYNGYILWDYAASAPYININMHKNNKNGDFIDAIFISAHKFLGGNGTPGILIFNQKLINKCDIPFVPGGGTVRFVCSRYQVYSSDIETRETGGTPNIIGSIKIGLLFNLKQKYINYIQERDTFLVKYVQNKLLNIQNLVLLNPIDNINRLPIFPIVILDMHYNLVVSLLNDLFGIATRGGISCCSLLAQHILRCDTENQDNINNRILKNDGVPGYYGWCRVSFHYTMPNYIVDYIIYAINFVSMYGHLFKSLYTYIPCKNLWVNNNNTLNWNQINNSYKNLSNLEDDNCQVISIKQINKIIKENNNLALSMTDTD